MSLNITVSQIDTAIESVLTSGQSVTLGDTTYTAANLSALRQLREQVVETSSRASGDRPTFRAFKMDGMGY